LSFDQPTAEALVLKRLLEEIRPDFYYSLHNSWSGGAFYASSHKIPDKPYQELMSLLEAHRIPTRAGGEAEQDGIYALAKTRDWYDRLEQTIPNPEEVLQTGACSWEFLEDIKPEAKSFIAELPYLRHPCDGSKVATNINLRQLKIRIDAENKYLVSILLDEWQAVESLVNKDSAFYKKTMNGIVSQKDKLVDGLPSWVSRTREILFSPAFSRTVTEGERFETFQFDRFFVLCNCYEFVRLLKESERTPKVRESISRLESLFNDAFAELKTHIDIDSFEVIDCKALACVQLGSGLIMLNSMMA
jgi:hypothetical protein